MNKITKIKITKEEYKNISKYTAIPIGIVFLEEKKGCYLQGNKEDFEKLLDRLSNYFVEHGIDKKEEINAIGYNIERLHIWWKLKREIGNLPNVFFTHKKKSPYQNDKEIFS